MCGYEGGLNDVHWGREIKSEVCPRPGHVSHPGWTVSRPTVPSRRLVVLVLSLPVRWDVGFSLCGQGMSPWSGLRGDGRAG